MKLVPWKKTTLHYSFPGSFSYPPAMQSFFFTIFIIFFDHFEMFLFFIRPCSHWVFDAGKKHVSIHARPLSFDFSHVELPKSPFVKFDDIFWQGKFTYFLCVFRCSDVFDGFNILLSSNRRCPIGTLAFVPNMFILCVNLFNINTLGAKDYFQESQNILKII